MGKDSNASSICVFGDSTSWGAWDDEKGGWVNRLWLSLIDHEPYVTLYNLGIDGGTSQTILERFEFESKFREGDAFIFQTGGNDASSGPDGVCRVPLEDFKKNIEGIIIKAKKITTKIVFVDLKNCDEAKTTPVSWDTIYYRNAQLEAYNNVMREVCNEHNVLHLDLGVLDNDDFEDGLHLNAKGHEKIFSKINSFLIEQSWI